MIFFSGGEILDDFLSLYTYFFFSDYSVIDTFLQNNVILVLWASEGERTPWEHVSGLSWFPPASRVLRQPWCPFPHASSSPALGHTAWRIGTVEGGGSGSQRAPLSSSPFMQPAMGWTKRKRATMSRSSGMSTAAVTPRGQASWTGRSWPNSAWSFIWKSSCPSFCKHFSETTTLPGWVTSLTSFSQRKAQRTCGYSCWHLRNTNWLEILIKGKLGGNGVLFFLLCNICVVERSSLRLLF